jgi:hypothetical protein
MPAYTRKWVDLNAAALSGAQKVSVPKFACPFDGDSNAYVLTQEWESLAENFTPLALNTAHPDYPTYLLVKEGPLQDIGNACVRWTRTYALLPNSRADASSMSYNFIGFYGYYGTATVFTANKALLGRARFQRTVSCRIQFDYFLISSGNIYQMVGGVLTSIATGSTIEFIPVIGEQLYYSQSGQYVAGTWTPDYTTGSQSDQNYGLATDSILDQTTWNSIFTTVVPTVPSRATYQGWINNSTEIVAEGSSISRWMGNMYSRVTKYVVAQ